MFGSYKFATISRRVNETEVAPLAPHRLVSGTNLEQAPGKVVVAEVTHRWDSAAYMNEAEERADRIYFCS